MTTQPDRQCPRHGIDMQKRGRYENYLSMGKQIPVWVYSCPQCEKDNDAIDRQHVPIEAP